MHGLAAVPPFERAVREAIARGATQLLAQQDDDSFWREFALAPGASESWATAWVGWCLAGTAISTGAPHAAVRNALARARSALATARRAGGWGYNRSTGPDADSTA
jgi:hypothetical protein